MDPVTFRLNAYKLYEYGDVIWYHPKLYPDGVICKKPLDINDPKTYSFPAPITGEILSGQLVFDSLGSESNWGPIHSFFEELSKEWSITLNNISVSL